MRSIHVPAFALSITLLVLGPVAHARQKAPPRPAVPKSAKTQSIMDPGNQPPTIDIGAASPVAFLFFFQHLANLDAAADSAMAGGNANAAQWKTLEQRATGLTDAQAAILKGVAYDCNQALRDHDAQAAAAIAGGDVTVSTDPPTGRMDIVNGAVADLQAQLGDEAFQTLSQYVQDNFGSGVVESAPGPPLPPTSATPQPGGDPGPPGVAQLEIPEVDVTSHVSKLSGWEVLAECVTSIDSVTAQYYVPLTICTLQGSLGANVPCDIPGNCVSVIPVGPGAAEQTVGTHALRMQTGDCGGVTGLLDPLHYCPATPQFVGSSGTLYPPGDSACYAGVVGTDNCAVALTASAGVLFVSLSPFDVTLPAGGQQRFTPNIPAHLTLSGPGTLDNTGLYKAPATLNGPQTATITACDANPAYFDDCIFSTIHLQSFGVDVSPASGEVLPGGQSNFSATVTPSSPDLKVTWTLIDPTNAGSITADATDSTKAVFKAPAKDKITATQEITVKACVKPDNVTDVCGTAKVLVPVLQMYIVGSKHTLITGETIQLTAFVNGSSLPRPVNWKVTPKPPDNPQSTDAKLTVITPDTLVANYKASDFEKDPVSIQVCLKDAEDFCTDPYLLQIVDPVRVTSVTGDWNAGELAEAFTITGEGFGDHPTVTFDTLQSTVLSTTDTQISGVVVIPVAQGGSSPKITVQANYGDDGFALTVYPQTGQPPIHIVPVSLLAINPTTTQLQAGGSQTFSSICLTAKNRACSSPETVRWSASTGTIDPTGPTARYTAPTSVPSNTTATINACWSLGAFCAQPAHVTLTPATGVTVSPPNATVQAGHTQQFTAQVTGTTNTGVTWSLNPSTPDAGSISQTGLYTAPAPLGSVTTVTVIATSQADSTKQGSAPVTLTPPPPQPTVTITPSPAAAVYGTALTWTAHASGGEPATLQYAFFRRRVGTNPWTPDVTTPAWQASNVYTWIPASTDVGTWEIVVWVRDGNTPANANTYGYAAYANAGPVRIVAPLSITVTPSPASAPYGSPITWTVTASGGDTVTLQYALFRRRAGTTSWIPDVTAPAWQSSNVLTWTPAAADAGTWEILVEAKDVTTPANSIPSVIPGPVVVTAPLSLTVTPSPAYSTAGNAITWTATASGGDAATIRYAFFRRRAGTTPWTPDVTAANWQVSNTFSWTPTPAETGTWEIVVWVKDGATPASANTYGYAAYANAGPVQVVAPLTLTSTPTSPTVVTYGTTLTWTVSSTGGVPGTVQYTLARQLSGTTNWLPSPLVFQSGNVLTWTPTAADVGTWAIGIGVRDSLTPPTANGFGVAASVLPGTVKVVAPLNLTTTPSPASSTSGTTLTWTATATGGDSATTQYAFFRRRAGTIPWTPDVTAPNWQTSNVFHWTPTAADAGTWEIILWAKDASTAANTNTYGYSAYVNAGPVQVYNPITLTGTSSPSSAYYGNTLNWTANPSGGTAGTFQYAFFRRRLGTTPWTPDVTAPNWQSSNVLSWTPGSTDTGTWEIIIWVKDANTPATLNGYGFGAYYNAGLVLITAPLSLSVTPSPSSSQYGTTINWTATASGGNPATTQYAFFRRRAGTTSWTPDVTAPNWQSSNTFSWTPAAGDIATWEIVVWVRDGATSPSANGYGFAAYVNAGPVQITN